jgi:hypothetical protein
MAGLHSPYWPFVMHKDTREAAGRRRFWGTSDKIGLSKCTNTMRSRIYSFCEAAAQVAGALRHHENETLGERCDDNQQDHEGSD